MLGIIRIGSWELTAHCPGPGGTLFMGDQANGYETALSQARRRRCVRTAAVAQFIAPISSPDREELKRRSRRLGRSTPTGNVSARAPGISETYKGWSEEHHSTECQRRQILYRRSITEHITFSEIVRQHFCADKGYDYDDVRQVSKGEGYIPHIKRRRRRGQPEPEPCPTRGETQSPSATLGGRARIRRADSWVGVADARWKVGAGR